MLVDAVTVLNPSLPLPFPVAEEAQVDERLRLQYRYLDLRRPRMARNLVLRHKRRSSSSATSWTPRASSRSRRRSWSSARPRARATTWCRAACTPASSTPCRSRPQQFKQLLMVAGVDRYFQIARCFRDEDLRANRQPEFTQLDLEMSFVEQDDVLDVIESAVQRADRDADRPSVLSKPFPRLTYAEAMDRYGTDKPDLRFGLPIVDLSDDRCGSRIQRLPRRVERGGVRARPSRAPGRGRASPGARSTS